MRDSILFSAGGRPPCDSALELAFECETHYPHLRRVWIGSRSRRQPLLPLPNFAYVRPGSLRLAIEMSRARLLVTTHGSHRARALRVPTLQTYHGIPVKRLGARSLTSAESKPPVTAEPWTGIICPSDFYLREVIQANRWQGALLGSPLPRHRLPRRIGKGRVRRLLRRRLDLAPTSRIVMFAPTYRAEHDSGRYSPGDAAAELRAKLPRDVHLLHRRHYLDAGLDRQDSTPDDDALIVLQGCDALITDYSSLVFDAAVIDTPTILLVPDVDVYSMSPGLTIPLFDVLPGSVAMTAEAAASLVVDRLHHQSGPWSDERRELLKCAGLADARREPSRAVSDFLGAHLV